VNLAELVERLADAGAVSVEMELQFLVEDDRVQLRVPIVPAKAAPIVGPIDSVRVAGETYPLNTTLTCDGPYGTALNWMALYVSDGVQGLNPLPIKQGLENTREIFEGAKAADSMRELEIPNSSPKDSPIHG
jgi:hypothetical protein